MFDKLAYRSQCLLVDRHFANQKPICLEAIPSPEKFSPGPFPLTQLARECRMNLSVANSRAVDSILLC